MQSARSEPTIAVKVKWRKTSSEIIALNGKMSGQLPDFVLRMFILKGHLDKNELPFQTYKCCITGMGARRHVTY
jgi:hypothetical protein